MKKIINNDNVVLILLVLATLLVGITNFLIIYFANFLIIYLPGIGFALAILVMLLSVYVLLVIELKSKWKKVVQLIMLILMFGTSISSIASISHAMEKENTHNEMVKKEREDKHLKQVIDREISKQLDQRMDEINNRK